PPLESPSTKFYSKSRARSKAPRTQFAAKFPCRCRRRRRMSADGDGFELLPQSDGRNPFVFHIKNTPRGEEGRAMSFSQDVKNEILRRKITRPCCCRAAAYAAACFGKYFDERGIVLQTETEGVAHFVQRMYSRCGIAGEMVRKERPAGPVFESHVQ